MKKSILILLCLQVLLFSADSLSDTKEKLELQEIKKELKNFYAKKEKEYQDRKKELSDILKQIENEKKRIEVLKNENEELVNIMTSKVEDKTTQVYNKMKPKEAAKIFNEMIGEGNFDDVFAIILKIKANKITQIMKYLTVANASTITQALEDFKRKQNIKNKE